jgi:hypothetical protein
MAAAGIAGKPFPNKKGPPAMPAALWLILLVVNPNHPNHRRG